MYLEKLIQDFPPEAYLKAENFKTKLDKDFFSEVSYNRGLNVGKLAGKIYVTEEGAWSADNGLGNAVSRLQIIGIMPNSADFWEGILDSGASIIVKRNGKEHQIK